MENKLKLMIGMVSAAGLLSACGSEQQTNKESTSPEGGVVVSHFSEDMATEVFGSYHVEIKRTSYGIPHITAANYGSLGFGEGYAAAEDHVCNIAYGVVSARGERAKYFGMGAKNKHYMSDVVIHAMDIPKNAVSDFEAQSDMNKEWLTGYAEGYNKYIRDTGVENITSWCKGAEWVKEITPVDIMNRFGAVAQTGPRMAGMIVGAKPPQDKKQSAVEGKMTQVALANFDQELDAVRSSHLGSNGWAIGKDRTENGRGMLMGNPHYPWTGTNRFWEKHLIIPGQLNIYGSHLVGAPGVAIGFNENVGWTHTVSDSERVTFYKLKLAEGDPTSYHYDGEIRKITPKKVNIEIKGPDGNVMTKEHTVWFSHYGPMIAMPNVPWSKQMAVTIRDANAGNKDLFSQWNAMNHAKSMDEFKAAHKKWNAMPWVNTMATSKDGRAVYIDDSNVGRISKEAIDGWKAAVKADRMTAGFYHNMGLILLDGSDSKYEWQAHPEARVPGVVPYVEQPKQDRTDYIFNANDSHWLTNVKEPLEGYSPLYGPERTARSLRTRVNSLMLSDTSANGGSGADGKFSLKELQDLLFSNRSLSAELLRDELVKACTATPKVMVKETEVDLTEACAALASYNGQLNLDSKGAVIFREWITRYNKKARRSKGELFAVPFDVNDPENTPRDLSDKKVALEKLGQAVLALKAGGIAVGAALGDAQYAYRGDEKIAIHGGNTEEGIANIIGQWNYDTMAKQVRGKKIPGSPLLTDKGYAITYGASFLLSLSYTDNGPHAEAFLTYSQSGDPTSPHYTDQTKLFSKKAWRPVLFNAADIDKDIKSKKVLTAPRP